MANHKTRLEKLEMVANEQPRARIEIIEIHKPREDGSEEVESWHLREDGSMDVEVKTYLKISPLDSEGNPIASFYLPDNGRDDLDQIKNVSTETD